VLVSESVTLVSRSVVLVSRSVALVSEPVGWSVSQWCLCLQKASLASQRLTSERSHRRVQNFILLFAGR
jgi:hypothetical protein